MNVECEKVLIVLQNYLSFALDFQSPCMATSLYPLGYPPQLSRAQVQSLSSIASEWAIAHGLVIYSDRTRIDEHSHEVTPGYTLATAAPLTLFPSLLPRNCFSEALHLQRAYNELYAKVVRDVKWLGPIIHEYVHEDSRFSTLWS